MFKKLLITALLSVFIFSFANTSEAKGLKIAYVSIQEVLNLSKAGKAAKERLEKEIGLKEEDLKKMQEELQTLREEYEKKKDIWNSSTRKEKEEVFQKKSMEFQTVLNQQSQEMAQKRKSIEENIIEGISEIVEEMAEKKGFDVVFEEMVSGLIYVDKKYDITRDVLKKYDKSFKED